MTIRTEKMIAIAMPGEDWALEGIFNAGDGPDSGGAVVAAPHPLYGGSMDSPVVSELSFACQQVGHATVRFNWRGVGASGGAPTGDLALADADYAAALDFLEETVPGPIVAAGYSFGAAAAVRVAIVHPRVRRLILVAPPPALLDGGVLDRFRGRILAVAGDRDTFAPPAELDRLFEGERRSLAVVPDADHFFQCGIGDISRAVAGWLDA